MVLVCGVSLTAHWAFMFWHQQQLRNLPDVLNWTDAEKNRLASAAMYLVIGSSILGNFFAGWLARLIGYRATIVGMFLAYFLAMFGAYCVPRDHVALLCWFPLIGFCQGGFALFTMYLPPLFPTLLRTTGAGFCYNIGRITAAFGTVFFGLFSKVGDHRAALFYAGFLFLPAAVMALLPAAGAGLEIALLLALATRGRRPHICGPDQKKSMNTPIRVAVTGAAGQIGYSLLFRIASGAMFGPNQPLILHLIEIEPALPALNGVVMELDDCAFPLLKGVVPTASLDEGFRGVNWALLVGSVPRKAGMERKELLGINGKIFIGQGQAIQRNAARDVRILVVGNPCNTNCLIAMNNAPRHPARPLLRHDAPG